MKKRVSFLMIAAISVAAGPASAADPITLKLGGKLRHFFFVADQDNAPGENLSSTGMLTNAEVYFDGRTILDNGVEVRATIELEAESRNDRNADEVYIDFITGLGKFRIGEKEGVSAAMIADPVPEAFLTTEEEIVQQVVKPRTGLTTRDAFTFKRYADDVLGVSYETPALIQGFKFGVTYQPSTGDNEGVFDKADRAHDAWQAAARYEGRFRGGSYRLAGGYFHSSSSIGRNDGNEGWVVHAGVTYGGWDVAGSYAVANPATGLDEKIWVIGALYGIGPYKISASHSYGKRDLVPGAVARETVSRSNIQGAMRIGPGITLGVTGFYTDQRDSNGVDWDGLGAIGGAKLSF
ncbi:MAG: porin [Rhodobacteraceae bacterium]|nr:porin [Paracoccaceae bacterium]